MSTRHTAVIVGASRGIGAALAHEFLLHGLNVAALARTHDGPALLSIESQYPGLLTRVGADVTDGAGLAEAAMQVKAVHDAVDVVINNAGVLLSRETPGIERYDVAEVEETLQTNTVGGGFG